VFAVVVGIEYHDLGNPNIQPGPIGGPLWTGFVDTTADTLTIETWRELPGHGADFWMPTALPLVWPAVTATGARYDVPDTFGDAPGMINDSFAFISEHTLQEPHSEDHWGWELQLFDAFNQPTTRVPKTFTGNVPIYPGWGGYSYEDEQGDQIFLTANPNPADVAYDESIMLWLPITEFTFVYNKSDGATVFVIGNQTGVPEASAPLALSVALAGFYLVRRKLSAARPA
jgi:hypothetical protein